MMGIGNPVHLAFLMVVLMLLFGAKRLPEMGRSLGSGLAGFKDALSGAEPEERPAELPAALAQANAAGAEAPPAVSQA